MNNTTIVISIASMSISSVPILLEIKSENQEKKEMLNGLEISIQSSAKLQLANKWICIFSKLMIATTFDHKSTHRIN